MGNSAFDNLLTRIPFIPLSKKSGINEKDAGYTARSERDKGKIRRQERPAEDAKKWQSFTEHKVNPLGGCLPVLPPVPVFFAALQRSLSVAIELRGAPFILWITDLAGWTRFSDTYLRGSLWLAVSLSISYRLPWDYNGHPAEDDAIVSRPCPAEDDDAHADYIYIHVS